MGVSILLFVVHAPEYPWQPTWWWRRLYPEQMILSTNGQISIHFLRKKIRIRGNI